MTASVPQDLVDIVACPKCKGKLSFVEDGSAFVCETCRLSFAVENGIANFLVDEAKPIA